MVQERIEKHTARDIVSYAYGIMLRRHEISVLHYVLLVPVSVCMYHTERPAGLQIAGYKSNYEYEQEATVIQRGQTTPRVWCCLSVV